MDFQELKMVVVVLVGQVAVAVVLDVQVQLLELA
jgi:hypothetical protein